MKKRILSFFLAVAITLTVFVPVPALVSADTYIPYEDVYIPDGYQYYGAWRWAINNKFYIGYFNSSPYVNGTEMMYSYADGGNPENVKTALNYKLYGGKCLYYKFDSYEDMVIALSSADACLRLCSSTNSSTGYMRLTAYPDVYFSNFSIDSGDCVFNENLYSSKLIDTYLGRDSNNSGYWVGAVVGSHDVSGFSDWFLRENKVNDLVNIGFSVTTDKVNEVINWWDKYGASSFSISIGLPALITITAINNLSLSLVERVVYTLDSLYLQYKNYCNSQDLGLIDPNKNNNVHMPHHRVPVSDDSEYDLTTDSDDDDTIISILREILRTLIYLPSDISSYLSYIQTYLDAILIDFNRLLDYICSLPDLFAKSSYNIFIEPINLIIDALGNVGSSTNIEIEIPETKKDEVDLFFDEWHTNFSDAINNKVPVYSQLSSLFNDDFFEKCGLDVNGDGETFAYYTAPGSVGSGDVQTLALNTSALSDSGEHVAVRSLLDQFDHADTSYLDDASYSGDIPEGWTVTVGGQDIEIFDFRIYAKHRTKIHVIITFILYSTYLLSLLKSIPTLIGNVSDVRNAFDAHSQKEE